MFAYLVHTQPFKHKVTNVLLIINEGALVCISLIQQVFKFKVPMVIDSMGWAMITIMCVEIFTNFLISITYNVRLKFRK